MEQQSLWLGRLREPVRYGMFGFLALTTVLFIWFVIAQFVTANPVGMHEMIRPAGRPLVQLMLVAVAGSLLFASIFVSDTRGAIEQEPDGFFDIFSLVCGRMAMIAIGLVVLVMFYEVVSRYVFSRPTLWANEMSWWIAAFIYLFAGQYAMQQRSHIRIFVIYDVMPRWMQKTADVLSTLMILVFVFAMVWGGWNDAVRRMLRMETLGTAWDPPIPGTIKPALLIIIVLVAIQAISNLIADWNKAPEHHGVDAVVDETEIENIRATLKDD